MNVVRYVLRGNGDHKPMDSGKSGFMTQSLSVDAICNEMIVLQQFFGKTDGIRLRHNMVTIDKYELGQGKELEQADMIAKMMSQFYLYKGFQNVWSVSCDENKFYISYAINTVSCYSGVKYHYNKHDVHCAEYAYLQSIVALVVKHQPLDKNIDYTELEYYPYSC